MFARAIWDFFLESVLYNKLKTFTRTNYFGNECKINRILDEACKIPGITLGLFEEIISYQNY